jgi:hypothetical protein
LLLTLLLVDLVEFVPESNNEEVDPLELEIGRLQFVDGLDNLVEVDIT